LDSVDAEPAKSPGSSPDVRRRRGHGSQRALRIRIRQGRPADAVGQEVRRRHLHARLDPAAFLGLDEGDAHVIRNAGWLVNDETIRSLVISHHLLGTEEAVVIGHTDCGMLTFTNEDVHEKLGPESESIDFQPFPDVAGRVRQSVETIRSHPLLPDSFGATGFVYDVRTGRIDPV
jgi:carbonic anhydrase